jgi:hypothetical protein
VSAEDAARSDLVDLGGCEGCALGCAVTCEVGDEGRALSARQLLVASGLGAGVLGLGPGLVARHPVVTALGIVTALLGAAVAALAGLAVHRGRPAGDPPARVAYRLLTVAVVGVLATGAGVLLVRLG